MQNHWPSTFDFNADEICQAVFSPFIEGELAQLKAYDALRPADITYIFYEHALRVAEDVRQTCLFMKLPESVANNMFWAALPHDIGKRFLPPALWDSPEKPDGDLKALRRSHTHLGADMAAQRFAGTDHPFKTLMIDIMRHHHEHMDGTGTHGLTGYALCAPVRLVSIVEAYDGYTIPRPHFGDRDTRPPAVLEKMRDKGAALYDMDFFEAFAKMKMESYKAS